MKKKKEFTKQKIWFWLLLFLIIFDVSLWLMPMGRVLLNMESIDYREDKTILIKEDVIKTLNQEYKKSEVERAFCIGGKKVDDNTIEINKVDELITKEKGTITEIQYSGGECKNIKDEEFLGIIHFHINLLRWKHFGKIPLCYLSAPDYIVHGQFINMNEDYILSGLQCGKDKFIFISSDIPYKSWKIQIVKN